LTIQPATKPMNTPPASAMRTAPLRSTSASIQSRYASAVSSSGRRELCRLRSCSCSSTIAERRCERSSGVGGLIASPSISQSRSV
jgi:hypothetical protein